MIEWFQVLSAGERLVPHVAHHPALGRCSFRVLQAADDQGAHTLPDGARRENALEE